MHNGYDIYYQKNKKGYDIKVASWKSPVTSQLYIEYHFFEQIKSCMHKP